MEVKKPLFIVGTGRCGSTIFHHMFSHHPHVAWMSPSCAKYPSKPRLNRTAMHFMSVPLLARYMRKKIYPGEWYAFWDYHCPGFSEPCRDLDNEDVSRKIETTIRKIMGQMLTSSRFRLLVKITGWPRIRFLKEIFPDAKFIRIYRDGRAVATSLLNVPWWSGWRGPDNWRWGKLPPPLRGKWESFGQSFVVLAGIEWEILMDAYERAKQGIHADDLLDIRYEELCQDPLKVFKKVAEFSTLEWTKQFEAAVKRYSLKSNNDKWKKHLSAGQQRILNESLKDSLEKYGYW